MTGKITDIWKKYEDGTSYNSSINLYDTVDTNEAFYAGNQWRGVNAPDLDKPVINITQRGISYLCASLVSDAVSIHMEPSLPNEQDARFLRYVAREVEKVREQNNMSGIDRECIRDGAVKGDACLYLYWDADAETGQANKGGIKVEIIENINCLFGNPYNNKAQEQPYIIIVRRRMVDQVRMDALYYGMSDADVKKIKPDDDGNQGETANNGKLCTELVFLERKKNDRGSETIHCTIATRFSIVRQEWDTGLRLYPVAWFCWQKSRKSYHGVSAMQGIIPNQIAINKLMALKLRCEQMYAWPKIIYDSTKIRSWSNKVGQNIAVSGPIDRVFEQVVPGSSASASVSETIQMLSSMTKESIGVNDAAMGQVKADNAAAIIELREASIVPLELQRQEFYSFEEQITRIMIDMLREYGGKRYQSVIDDQQAMLPNGLPAQIAMPTLPIYDDTQTFTAPQGTIEIDFSRLNSMSMSIDIDIGAGSYYNEILLTRSLDNLYKTGAISALTYIKHLPEKSLPGKASILKDVEEAARQQEQIQPQSNTI